MAMFAPEPGLDPGFAPEEPEEPSESPTDVLREMFEIAQRYLSVEQDEEDKEKGAKILAQIQQLLALNQKQNDEMMGASPAAKALRKSYAQ